jgi:tRNA(Ile)-lysidine synthase
MIATAHHLNDNAETVLFNLSRGTALSGMTGIRDKVIERNGVEWEEIRPLIGCSRKDIDEYVESNAIPYVTDATNFTLDYTRNRIRHNVLPELEKAVPEAAKAIFRFSRLAAEDEEYFARQTEKIIKDNGPYGYTIATCDEKVIFKRAAVKILNYFKRKDYTAEHAQRLFDLQYAEVGKQFKFLGLTAFKEKTGIAIAEDKLIFPEGKEEEYLTFERQRSNIYCGQYLWITTGEYIDEDLDELQDNMQFKELSSCGKVPLFINVLQYDKDKIPKNCVVRFARSGDKFKKFGGGTKNLGDFFTDKKIPKRLRGVIPLIAQDNFVYVVCGVEISDDVKVDENTKNVGFIVCNDYLQPI